MASLRARDRKAASRAIAPVAAFFDRRSEQRREKTLHRAADVWPLVDCGRQEAAESTDAERRAVALDFVRRSELLQECRRALDALRDRAARPRPLGGESVSDIAHERIEIGIRHALAQRANEVRRERHVSA